MQGKFELKNALKIILCKHDYEQEYLHKIGGGIDFDGMADIHFDYSPHTIKEACKILREELLKHEDLYRAFSASIYSALKDISEDTEIDEMPEIILSRMIGED